MSSEMMETDTIADRYLCFSLGSNSFGLPIAMVREIVEMQEITPVPHMPEYLRGVVNLRGQVIPVMDLRLRLALPFREYDRRTCIVMVEHEHRLVGLVVDRMEEVRHFDGDRREAAPEFRDDTGMSRFVEAMGRVDQRVVMLLNVTLILEKSRIAMEEYAH